MTALADSAAAQTELLALLTLRFTPGLGPLGGLEALARACRTPWLLTLPVDVVDANDCLPRTLASAGGDGAVARDADGLQPLVALYRVAALRAAVAAAIFLRLRQVRRIWPPSHLESLSRPAPSSSSRAGGPPPAGHRPPLPPAE